MAIVRKPNRPVPRNYIPPRSRPYRVRNGESWVTIARQHRMSPWQLIELNFKTDDPQEVNWYLREYVGCSRETRDGRNYMFSSSDKPGIVHVPAPKPTNTVPPPIFNPPAPNKKLVLVGLIEKEKLFNVDTFGAPGSVRWSGSKHIIYERYDYVPKDYVELGMAKGPQLHYSATGFSKTTIHRYEVLWGPRGSTAEMALKAIGKVAWLIIRVQTNSLEGAIGTRTYQSWKEYPRDSSDPMNKFRP